jgi:hypothetical protein
MAHKKFPPLTPYELTRSRLALASKDASIEIIKTWTKKQRDAADRWAMREHLVASDNDHLRRMKCPAHVEPLPDVNYDGIWPSVSGREP